MTAPRLRVLAGSPTAEELAAVVVALDALRAAGQDAEAAAGAPALRGWRRAARLEALGTPRIDGRDDLRTLRP